MLITAAILLAVDFSVQNVYGRLKGVSPKSMLGFNCLLGLFTVLIFYSANGFSFVFTLYSFAMAAIMNTLVFCYRIIGFHLMKKGNMASYTMFLMAGGMIVPYIWGILFLDEKVSVFGMIALIFVLCGIVLSNSCSKKEILNNFLMCFAVFFLNGFVSVVSKLHQIQENFATVSAEEFVILGAMFNFVFSGFLYMFWKKDETLKHSGKNILAAVTIIASAAVGGLSYFLQLRGAESLPATMLYPFVSGGSIVFSAAASAAIFKEKFSAKRVVGVIICFVGTLIFLLEGVKWIF